MRALSLKAPYELELQKREIPTVGKGQALIRVLNTAICGSDLHAYRGRQAIFDYPRVMGHEVCGIVEALEGGSGNISPGDKVVLIPYANCKTCIACRKGKPGCCTSLKVMGVHTDGAMAEYCVVDEEYLIRVSQDMDSIYACLVEPFAISTHAVHTAGVKEGETVLVTGCGPIGLGAALIAGTYGARVILADVSEERRTFAQKTFGYEHVLNPMDGDYKERLAALTGGDMPDTIIESTGNAYSMSHAFEYLSHGGKVVYVGIASEPLTMNHVDFHKRQAELYGSRAATRFDFEYVIRCIEEKKINPGLFMTDLLEFDDGIAKAFKRAAEKGAAMFKGVIHISD